jgi:CubicO group peptidase (beta-lactamase class C family)
MPTAGHAKQWIASCAIVVASAAQAIAATTAFNFDAVTALAIGGINGQNVGTAVPGYEIRLLKNGAVVYDQAFGTSALGQQVNIDSSSKTFSGALIMSLTEQAAHPFSLDTRVAEYEPTFTGDKSAITIRQAFSHTSGLDANNLIGSHNLTLQQTAASIGLTTPLTYGPPGTQFSYGGTSMQAAGAAAEVAGGQSWDTLFADRIATPLHLTNTHFVLSSPDNPRIAGGVESNAADFGRFTDMLLNGGVDRATGVRVLSAASVQTMLTRQTAPDVTLVNSPLPGATDYASTDYGVGIWLDQRAADGTLIGAIAAGARGACSWLDLDDGYVGVIATDSTSFSNIRDLQYLIRDAAQTALRSPQIGGDANLDHAVTFDDLISLAQHYNSAGVQTWANGDFTGDGHVNFSDLVILSQNYGTPASFVSEWALAQSLVPEPVLAIGVVAVAVFTSRRTRRVIDRTH